MEFQGRLGDLTDDTNYGVWQSSRNLITPVKDATIEVGDYPHITLNLGPSIQNFDTKSAMASAYITLVIWICMVSVKDQAMPKFLESALRHSAAKNGLKGKEADHYVYASMNSIGAMHGNKETAHGEEMQEKHDKDVKRKSPKKRKRKGEVFF